MFVQLTNTEYFMNILTRVVFIILIITTTNFVLGQSYTVTIDTINITSYSFEPSITIGEDASDSLSYDISFYSLYGTDSVLMFEETFDLNNPKIESFSKVDFNTTANQTKLVLIEADIAPFLAFIKVKQSGIIIEELIFDQYE